MIFNPPYASLLLHQLKQNLEKIVVINEVYHAAVWLFMSLIQSIFTKATFAEELSESREPPSSKNVEVK